MSTIRQQQWSGKNILCKQKSIDDKASDSHSNNKRILRKQLSVDHVTSSLTDAQTSATSIELNNLFWEINEPSLRIKTNSAVKKRAQFAVSGICANNSINKQDLISSCLSRTMKSASGEVAAFKAKDKININIFLSQDVHQDDVYSDNEAAPQITHKSPTTSSPSSSSASNGVLKSSNSGNSETANGANGRLSASTRRAQFQASRRIMSAPIRPMNIDDSKNKRKIRKKKVIRDKDVDESPDEYAEELEDMKQPLPSVPKNSIKKQQQMRSRSILGCDQIGIETLVSMLNSGESDSEKEIDKDKDKEKEKEIPTPQTIIKNDMPRVRSMLRKTVSFQEDDGQMQPLATGKDTYNIRRNSVVPFAGRMRNTRTLFGQEICNLYMNNHSSSSSINNSREDQPTVKNENDLNSSNHSQQEETKEKSKAKTKIIDESSDRKKSQDLLSQPREEECWRLYEKMKKTGLNISYDTILRGILKPSELRLLEKQKKLLGDIEEKNLEYHELEKAESP